MPAAYIGVLTVHLNKSAQIVDAQHSAGGKHKTDGKDDAYSDEDKNFI